MKKPTKKVGCGVWCGWVCGQVSWCPSWDLGTCCRQV